MSAQLDQQNENLQEFITMVNELQEINNLYPYTERTPVKTTRNKSDNDGAQDHSARKRPGSVLSSIKKKGGKLIKSLTPPRHLNVGLKTPGRSKTPGDIKLTLSSRFEGDYNVRSSETDPSLFQIEIPTYDSVLESCKLCNIMDNYTNLCGVDFDFKMLMPYMQMDATAMICDYGKDASGNRSNMKTNAVSIGLSGAVNDIVVQGFFRDYFAESNSDNGIGRVEVCILSSNERNKIYVIFRSSTFLQDKPIQGPQKKKCDIMPMKSVSDKENNSDTRNASVKDPINNDINVSFLGAFNLLKDFVFSLLERLTVLNPFHDVTFLGHSFGAGLATVAAGNFAKMNQGTRVYCHVFGSPKVGGIEFRNELCSFSNLNILRMERHTDSFTSLPEDTNKWKHVGHCLTSGPSALSALTTSDDSRPIELQLYRFDKHRSFSKLSKGWNNISNLTKLKIGNEIRSYLKDLEKVKTLKIKWIDSFVGDCKVTAQNGKSFDGVFA